MQGNFQNSRRGWCIGIVGASLLVGCGGQSPVAPSAPETQIHNLDTITGLTPNGVDIAAGTFDGRNAVSVVKKPEAMGGDEPTFALVDESDFQDGTIEVELASTLAADAPDTARGFIGVTFHLAEDLGTFEGLYLRPTNGLTETTDPVRQSHAVQYFSYPDYKFSVLRETAPGVYEAPADIAMNRWMNMKIVVDGVEARLFIDDAPEPVLTVADLKQGANRSGRVALWVDVGTVGYFRNLRITHAP